MAIKIVKEAFSGFFDCYLDFGANLNIVKYLNITGRIFENVKLSIKNRNWKLSKKNREVFPHFVFLVLRPGFVL